MEDFREPPIRLVAHPYAPIKGQAPAPPGLSKAERNAIASGNPVVCKAPPYIDTNLILPMKLSDLKEIDLKVNPTNFNALPLVVRLLSVGLTLKSIKLIIETIQKSKSYTIPLSIDNKIKFFDYVAGKAGDQQKKLIRGLGHDIQMETRV